MNSSSAEGRPGLTRWDVAKIVFAILGAFGSLLLLALGIAQFMLEVIKSGVGH